MADSTHTPFQVHGKAHHTLNSLLRTVPYGTPYRTPNRRRFGPLGSSRRTPAISRQAGTSITGQNNTPIFPSNTISYETGVIQRTEAEENNIKELSKKIWRVFRLTPLYNYQTKQSDIQLYTRSLSAHIAAEKKKGLFVDTSVPGDATIGNFSGLSVGIDDPKAVLIEVKGKARNREDEKVICQAVLFSIDLEYNPLKPSIQDSFTYYSSMLIHGPEALSQTIQNWLEVQFDCRVIPQKFTSHELVFMTALFTGLGEDHRPVDLVYKVPSEVEGLSDISYSTKAEDCLRLWNRIRSTDTDSFTMEEASQFIGGLESHFYECFNIKLNAMPLVNIGTSVASIGRDGKLKLYSKSPDNVLKVLRHLTDLALDQLKI